MASFACFSNSKEKTLDAYKDLISRLQAVARKELGDEPIFTSASFAYYSAHKGQRTHVYKDFIYQLRKTECENTCIMLCDNLPPQMRHYVQRLEEVQLIDGLHSNAYYGQIKKIVTSFLNYFTHIIDHVIRKIDLYLTHISNTKLMSLIDETIVFLEKNQSSFVEEFFPINSPKEQQMYDEIAEKNVIYIAQLNDMKESLRFMNKPEKIEEFAKEHFHASLKRTNTLCTFVHAYISMMLADRMYEIAVSVGETVDRMNTNMRQYNEECLQNMNKLINNLYDKNKEHLYINRSDRKRSIDGAEVSRTIEVLKDRIENYGNEEAMARLVLETSYWMKRMKDFNEISSIMTKINTELENLIAEEETYKKLRTTELPGSKSLCFEMMGDNFMQRRQYLEKKKVELSKALVTYFCVRGTDRILYTDNVGSYYCDEFNHQNYISDHGLKFFHVNCDGDFLENYETDPYYFDENGRYTLVNGEKVHQCAPCTSHYKLADNGLFTKITKDCGHSERINDKCRLEIKDLTDVEILPTTDIIDITRTLDSETVKYLWDNFGMVLPAVLYDLAMAAPKNPIHYLAHMLLQRKFTTSEAEVVYYKKMANKYRAEFYKDKKEKAAAESRAWKSKFVKRRKPEDLDDTADWAMYNQHVANWQFVNSLGYYYDMY